MNLFYFRGFVNHDINIVKRLIFRAPLICFWSLLQRSAFRTKNDFKSKIIIFLSPINNLSGINKTHINLNNGQKFELKNKILAFFTWLSSDRIFSIFADINIEVCQHQRKTSPVYHRNWAVLAKLFVFFIEIK